MEQQRAITLTTEERAALLELGLRPTYSIEPGVAYMGDPDLVLRNAQLLAFAARVTQAGNTGVLPPDLHAEVADLLREAIHDTRHELWSERRSRDLWRDGAPGYAGVSEADQERCYAHQIELCARLFDAFTSLALKLNAW